jgi:hypothetical protein
VTAFKMTNFVKIRFREITCGARAPARLPPYPSAATARAAKRRPARSVVVNWSAYATNRSTGIAKINASAPAKAATAPREALASPSGKYFRLRLRKAASPAASATIFTTSSIRNDMWPFACRWGPSGKPGYDYTEATGLSAVFQGDAKKATVDADYASVVVRGSPHELPQWERPARPIARAASNVLRV